MTRITDKDVEARIENLNRRLLRFRSKRRVKHGKRYEYNYVDEYDTKGNYYGAIITGTKRECYDALGYMMRAIDLEHRKW